MSTDLGEVHLAISLFVEQTLVFAHSDRVRFLRDIVSLDGSINFKEFLLVKTNEVVRSLDDVSVRYKSAWNIDHFVDNFMLIGFFDNLLINFTLIFDFFVIFDVFLPVVFELNDIFDSDSVNCNVGSEHVVLRVLLCSLENLHFWLVNFFDPVHVKVFKHIVEFLLMIPWLSDWSIRNLLGFLVGHRQSLVRSNLVLGRSHKSVFNDLLISDDHQNAEDEGVLEEADHSAGIEEKEQATKVNIVLSGILGNMFIILIQPVGDIFHSISVILLSWSWLLVSTSVFRMSMVLLLGFHLLLS